MMKNAEDRQISQVSYNAGRSQIFYAGRLEASEFSFENSVNLRTLYKFPLYKNTMESRREMI